MLTDFVSCNGLLGLVVVIKVDEYIWAFILYYFFYNFLFFNLNFNLFSGFSFFAFSLFGGFSFFHFFGFLVIILGISPLTTATT